MSDAPEPKSPLDLTDLRLMPKWVADFGKTAPSTGADHGGEDAYERDRNRDRRGPRDGGGGGGGQRRSFGGGGGYGGGGSGGPPRGDRKPFDRPRGPGGPSDRGPRPQGDRRDDRRGGGGGGGTGGPRRDGRDRPPYGRGGQRDDRGGRPPYEQAPTYVAGLNVHVEPEARATEAMAAMIRTAGKAYSVFDAARLVLASGERFHVKFKLGTEATAKLYVVPTDGSVWLNKEEALSHVLHGDALSAFYKTEEVELEEPKGNFTSVAICGMSGELLGPPSHHSYQTALHKIHRERFSHLPFEDYKRRVRTESTPEAVAKWKESQKHGTQWTWLKGDTAEGAEPKIFKSRGEMEAHFRANHAETLVGEAAEATVSGGINKRLLSPPLYNHLRRAVDEARKHLLATAQQLCSGFERHGLKLFKRRGGKLWVSRTRPRLLDSSVVLSDRIAKMVEVIKVQPGIAVKKLIETVAPSADEGVAPAAEVKSEPVEENKPKEEPAPVAAVEEAVVEVSVSTTEESAAPATAAPTAEVTPPATGSEITDDSGAGEVEADAATGTAEAVENVAEEAAAETAPAPEPAPAPVVSVPVPGPVGGSGAHHEWTGDQLHALQDLHWLNSEGYVIEYADGVVFPGVTEPPPPKPKAAPAPKEKAEGSTAASPDESESPESPADEAAPAETPAEEQPTAEVSSEPAAATEEAVTEGEASDKPVLAGVESQASTESGSGEDAVERDESFETEGGSVGGVLDEPPVSENHAQDGTSQGR